MQLYDQLRALQNIPFAYDNWKEYRETITNYLLNVTSRDDRLILLGIGPSNDVDLRQLINQNRQLILIDRDDRLIQKALKKYNVENHKNVSVQIIDCLGLTDSDYRLYTEHLINEIRKDGLNTDMHQFSQYVCEQIGYLINQRFSMIKEKAYPNCDYVVAIGLHSQLLSMFQWIYQVIIEQIGKEIIPINPYLDALNQEIISKLHTQLLADSEKGFIIGYEFERINRKGRIAGAYQAELDLKTRVRKNELLPCEDMKVLWPLNSEQQINYDMIIQKYLKTNI